MTTDNDKVKAFAQMVANRVIAPIAQAAASKGLREYLETGEAVINVEDAIRAAKDRPSMERELAELRARLSGAELALTVLKAERDRLREECERLRGALRSLIQQVEFVRDAYWPLSEPCDPKLLLQAIHAWAETAAAFARTDLDPALAKMEGGGGE